MKLKERTKLYIAIGVIWLFHLSGILGIALGYKDWFITKTPLNFLACTILFIWVFPLFSLRKWMVFGLFFLTGMFAEWLGANFSLLFGSYDYGQNLGTKIDEVPLFIGINWALLTFVTATIASRAHHNLWIKAILGAFLMVFLDFLMEQSAPSLDYWRFEGEVPIENYITWFALALCFHLVFQKAKIKGDYLISLHLFLAQIVFFGFFMFCPF